MRSGCGIILKSSELPDQSVGVLEPPQDPGKPKQFFFRVLGIG